METSGYFSPFTSNSRWDINRMCFHWHPSFSWSECEVIFQDLGKFSVVLQPNRTFFFCLLDFINPHRPGCQKLLRKNTSSPVPEHVFSPKKTMNRGSGATWSFLLLSAISDVQAEQGIMQVFQPLCTQRPLTLLYIWKQMTPIRSVMKVGRLEIFKGQQVTWGSTFDRNAI